MGGRVSVHARPSREQTPDATARAVRLTLARLDAWAGRLTRFDPASELSRLNASPSDRVRRRAHPDRRAGLGTRRRDAQRRHRGHRAARRAAAGRGRRLARGPPGGPGPPALVADPSRARRHGRSPGRAPLRSRRHREGLAGRPGARAHARRLGRRRCRRRHRDAGRRRRGLDHGRGRSSAAGGVAGDPPPPPRRRRRRLLRHRDLRDVRPPLVPGRRNASSPDRPADRATGPDRHRPGDGHRSHGAGGRGVREDRGHRRLRGGRTPARPARRPRPDPRHRDRRRPRHARPPGGSWHDVQGLRSRHAADSLGSRGGRRRDRARRDRTRRSCATSVSSGRHTARASRGCSNDWRPSWPTAR